MRERPPALPGVSPMTHDPFSHDMLVTDDRASRGDGNETNFDSAIPVVNFQITDVPNGVAGANRPESVAASAPTITKRTIAAITVTIV